MARTFHPILGAAATASIWLACSIQAHSADVTYGRRIAERYCSACHAIDAGTSPNPRSPTFRKLYRRYRSGGLDFLLSEGMIAPTSQPEEGDARKHPRMPQAVLGEDEIAALKAYLLSLDPSHRHPPNRPPAAAAAR